MSTKKIKKQIKLFECFRSGAPCTNCHQKLLVSKLTDSFYYQFVQLFELKALKDINIKNISFQIKKSKNACKNIANQLSQRCDKNAQRGRGAEENIENIQKDKNTERQKYRKTDIQKNRKTEKQKYRNTEIQKYRNTDIQKNRNTERQKGRKTERQKDRNTEIQKYRNTEIQKYRNTEIQKYRYTILYYGNIHYQT